MSLRAVSLVVGVAVAVAAATLVLGAGSGPERQPIRPIELSGATAGPGGTPDESRAARSAAPIFSPRQDDIDGEDDDDPFDERPESREHGSSDVDEDDDDERPRSGDAGEDDTGPTAADDARDRNGSDHNAEPDDD